MTELFNRYSMEQHMSQAIRLSDGYFFVLDLDDFKTINDTMGHLIGDQVIWEFAEILKRVASPNALLGRMGGDEFAVWESGIQSKGEAESKFTNLLKACKEITSKLEIKVTCSAGIVFCHRDSHDFTDIYLRADQALYHAKALGKTRLYWADMD